MRAADRALCAAKASGRNAVVFYGGRPGETFGERDRQTG